MASRIERVNPLDHAAELKALFAEGTVGEEFFAPFYDRAYATAVAQGASSWIGRDEAGRLVMHMAVFRRRFVHGSRQLTGGLCVNLMVAREHRSVLPALALARRIIKDTAADGFDFLYADPNEGGTAICKLAGFTHAGSLERFAMPLAGRGAVESAAVFGWRLLRGPRRSDLAVCHHDAPAFDTTPWEVPEPIGARVLPVHPPNVFTERLAGYPSPADHWYTGERGGRALAAVQVRVAGDGLATIGAFRRREAVSLLSVAAGIAADLRRRGARRLQVLTVAGSDIAAELPAAGFSRRADTVPLLMFGQSEPGRALAADVSTLSITNLDCDR